MKFNKRELYLLEVALKFLIQTYPPSPEGCTSPGSPVPDHLMVEYSRNMIQRIEEKQKDPEYRKEPRWYGEGDWEKLRIE